MAGTIISSKLVSTTVLKVENQDTVAKNWSIEIWSITADGSNDATSKSITSSLTTPFFATAMQKSGVGAAVKTIGISGSDITVTFASAPATAVYLIKVEGWA